MSFTCKGVSKTPREKRLASRQKAEGQVRVINTGTI